MTRVSCRLFETYLHTLKSKDINVSEFLAGFSFDEKYIKDVENYVPWNEFCLLNERFAFVCGGLEQLENIGNQSLNASSSLINVVKLGAIGFNLSPKRAYWVGATLFAPKLFGVKSHYYDTDIDHIDLVIELSQEMRVCQPLFHIMKGSLSAVPRLFGLPDAKVELVVKDNRVIFGIDIPMRISLWQRFKHFFRAFYLARDAVDELKHQNDLILRRMEELAVAERQAALASTIKSQFLTNVSHEMRTPMNAIIGYLTLMQDTNLDDEQKNMLDGIRTASENFLGIINDILDFSKIDSEQVVITKTNFDLRKLLNTIADDINTKAKARGLEFNLRVNPAVPQWALGDPSRIRQILLNVLHNSIKFTPHGHVNLILDVESEDVAQNIVQTKFVVEDSGVGINQEIKDQIFQAFAQADGSLTRRFGGLGLGLAICKQLVDMMEGEIAIESIEKSGTTVKIVIPLQRKKMEDVVVLSSNAAIEGGEAQRIILVDDHEGPHPNFAQELEGLGLLVEVIRVAHDAPFLIRRAITEGRTCAAVVVDLQGDEQNAIGVARILKSQSETAAIPLVLVASAAVRGQADTARTAGYAAFLTHPFSSEQVRKTMATVLQLQHLAQDSQVSMPLITKHSVDEQCSGDKPRILIAEDNEINQKVLTKLLDKLGFRADAVWNGREAYNAICHSQYDVILMDCQMPEMDGYAATEAIRRHEEQKGLHTSIIAVTAHAMVGDREKCLNAGMDDYVTKPVRLDVLREALNKWLPQRYQNLTTNNTSAATTLPPTATTAALTDDSAKVYRLHRDENNKVPTPNINTVARG